LRHALPAACNWSILSGVIWGGRGRPALISSNSGCAATSPKFSFLGSKSWIIWSQICHFQTMSPPRGPLGFISTICVGHRPSSGISSGFLPACSTSSAVRASQAMARTLPFGFTAISWCAWCSSFAYSKSQSILPSQLMCCILPDSPPPANLGKSGSVANCVRDPSSFR